jgi:hypothetical protein
MFENLVSGGLRAARSDLKRLKQIRVRFYILCL